MTLIAQYLEENHIIQIFLTVLSRFIKNNLYGYVLYYVHEIVKVIPRYMNNQISLCDLREHYSLLGKLKCLRTTQLQIFIILFQNAVYYTALGPSLRPHI